MYLSDERSTMALETHVDRQASSCTVCTCKSNTPMGYNLCAKPSKKLTTFTCL